MKRWLAAVLFMGVFSTGASARAQTPAPAATGTLQGRISDSLGAAIIRGFFLVHSEGRDKLDQQLTLNENGEFHIQLAPGLYDLFIGSVGFVPYAKEIRIQANKPVVLKIKLKVDMESITED
ncbi:MAG: carboxypeptidase-like regulatory domain-containing protein [Terracidiphilus sp.]|jgi:hypothetical protein